MCCLLKRRQANLKRSNWYSPVSGIISSCLASSKSRCSARSHISARHAQQRAGSYTRYGVEQLSLSSIQAGAALWAVWMACDFHETVAAWKQLLLNLEECDECSRVDSRVLQRVHGQIGNELSGEIDTRRVGRDVVPGTVTPDLPTVSAHVVKDAVR